jgi:AraC-like DNA-binding protein
MIVTLAERLSDSPYIDAVAQGCTTGNGSVIRPAETNWHMVLLKAQGKIQLLMTGPLTTSGVVEWEEGGELLWLRFKLGVYMPHLPLRNVVDMEQPLPGASSQRFWLKSSAWQFPDYENVETFVERLVKEEILVIDPVVSAVKQNVPQYVAPRTLRHHFLRATGLTQNQVFQIERAQSAAMMLKQGVSILDTAYELGYFDQPHLTRALKQWIGYTPAQLYRSSIDCHFIQDPALWPDYTPHVKHEQERIIVR